MTSGRTTTLQGRPTPKSIWATQIVLHGFFLKKDRKLGELRKWVDREKLTEGGVNGI